MSNSEPSAAAAAVAATAAATAFKFLPQGGIIQSFRVGDQDIVLGFPSAASYANDRHPFFGENIGRVANRISGARIDRLNGRSYDLYANNGANTLHGGKVGWGKRTFEGPAEVRRDGREALEWRYVSADGEEGFPGTVELRMWYFTSVEERAADGKVVTSLELEYEAELVGSAGEDVEETVVSLTNHSYFNISGGPTIEGTRATVSSNAHLPVDESAIPTGEITPHPDIPSNQEFTFGATSPDPDHCFIVEPDASKVPLDTRRQPLRKLIALYHPATDIHFEALSTEPAFQLYAGKFCDVPAMDGVPARGARAGLCIEASRYVNAVNVDAWRHMVLLKKGQIWGSRTIYRAWV